MKITRIVGLAAVMFALSGSHAQAQVDFQVTPFTGGTFFLADPPPRFALHRAGMPDLVVREGTFEDAWTVGAGVGFRFAEMWAVEGMFSWLPTELTAASGLSAPEKANAFMYGVNGFFYLPVQGQIKPFLSLGAGAETFTYADPDIEGHTDWMGNAAIGLFYGFSETAGLRFEARDCFARFHSGVAAVDDAWENDLMLLVGLTLTTPIG